MNKCVPRVIGIGPTMNRLLNEKNVISMGLTGIFLLLQLSFFSLNSCCNARRGFFVVSNSLKGKTKTI